MNSSPRAPSPPRDGVPPDEARVADWWRRHAPRVQAYAMRHVDAHAAQEVVSETFLVAWRRHGAGTDEIPDDEVLPWLVGVARNVIRNAHRSTRRSAALVARLGTVAGRDAAAPAPDSAVAERAHVLLALARLTEKDREALLLVAWDGLSREQAARVAGCRLGTFDVRLSRARRRLTELLDADDLGSAVPSPAAPPRRPPAPDLLATHPLPDRPAGGHR
ncbi:MULTISPECIES: RNA polymerase sigma factor [unclassified Isoptericola]|uniref:RNA polymerase sigma factor n=1 Tax=unclassified Isoptericola TaxID=2623355 RepID=UPI00364CBBA1